MPGNKEGGKKAAATNKARHGDDYYSRIAGMPHYRGGGFANNREIASAAGKIGGKKSKRGKSAPTEEGIQDNE